MAVLKIGGVEMPTPSEMTPLEYDIMNEAGRDAKGTMHFDYVCTKQKLECSWKYLSQNDMTKISNAIKAHVLKVTFIDPSTGSSQTLNMYKGDRSRPILKFESGKASYKDFKVNFIEM